LTEATRQRKTTRPEPGSFRDWDGRVFASDGRILRALSAQGLADWEALVSSGLMDGEELVETRLAGDDDLESLREADPAGAWEAALSHERLPFVSYPYEWTFSMLQDAALLQLRLTSKALEAGLTLKDASPYNVQWRGSRPVFIDIGSFERSRPGEPWLGYRQFCMLYLYPLLLEAYRGVSFHSWLRGAIDGISPQDFRRLFSRRDALRRGMLRHVFLHASLERRYESRDANVREELSDAGFDSRLVEANVRQMAKLVESLRSRVGDSSWSGYRSTCSYSDRDAAEKDELVRRVVGRARRRMTWDLGCNDGRFARIAAEGADFTIAVDSDPVVVDGFYRSLRSSETDSILPLVVDLTNPSPAVGWRNAERSTLLERGAPDLVLCLALVHHLSISSNVPLREVVSWLRSFDCEVVVEFPDRDDPMVSVLLAQKRADAHPDYRRETFEALLEATFDVVESRELASGTRTLYHALPE
jgi:ribosomal protein L11 methylase PrmA